MGARFFAPAQTGPGAHPDSCTMGTGSFPGVKSGRGVTLTTHLLLVPWPRKSRDIPLLPLWAVRPVQSLSACTRVHFTLTVKLKDIYVRNSPLLSAGPNRNFYVKKICRANPSFREVVANAYVLSECDQAQQ